MGSVKTAKKREKRKRLAREITRVRTLIDGIARIPFRRSDKIGFDAEDRALKHAEYFKKKKIVKAAKLFERFSPDDQAGKDLMIEMIGGKIIYIQITAAYHSEDELKAHKQGNFYLAVYPGQNELAVREKLLMIILYGYFVDLGIERIREVLRIIDGLKQASVKSKKFRLKFWFFR